MNAPFIFSSGIFVIVLLLIGLIYTFKEFKEMNEHPDQYRTSESGNPKIVDKDGR